MTGLQVFYLEMNDPAQLQKGQSSAAIEVLKVQPPTAEKNSWFYENVGGPWNWQERLTWSADDWLNYVQTAGLSTYIALYQGEEAGYVELLEQDHGNVQLAYFGLLPDFTGKGIGSAFLVAAIRLAWAAPGARRVWLHTCSEDHPAALSNYQRRGFVLYKTETAPSKKPPTGE